MKETMQFVREHLRGERSVSELCRSFGCGHRPIVITQIGHRDHSGGEAAPIAQSVIVNP